MCQTLVRSLRFGAGSSELGYIVLVQVFLESYK